jgi:hypothetical protein
VQQRTQEANRLHKLLEGANIYSLSGKDLD